MSDARIQPYLSMIEDLGFEEPTSPDSPRWIRCYVKFSGIGGEEIIDIPVIISKRIENQYKFKDRTLIVKAYSEQVVKKFISYEFQKISSYSPRAVFQKLGELGRFADLP